MFPLYGILWNLFKHLFNWFHRTLQSIPTIFIICFTRKQQNPSEPAASHQVEQIPSVEIEGRHIENHQPGVLGQDLVAVVEVNREYVLRKILSEKMKDEVGERRLLGPELIQITVDKVKIIKERLRAAQSRQKSYADHRRRDLEFEAGDFVFLKVSPWKGVFRFGKKGKLSPRFIGPFEVLERIGIVAYRVALPPNLSRLHNVFHVSVLRKYVADLSHVLDYQPIQISQDMTYEEHPLKILDWKQQELRTRVFSFVKVHWRNHPIEEATWEREEEIKEKYP
ncbi:hypothetical protein Q3G72_003286 [Acer saccharum]|nr:hypothetical protein Q3G72_003286 [Acer saccharum]